MFVELFAGFGGLSREIAEVCGGLVHVLEPLDQHGGWDILTDDGFAQAKELVSKADHAHLAFPCRSFFHGTKIRSTWRCSCHSQFGEAGWMGFTACSGRKFDFGKSHHFSFLAFGQRFNIFDGKPGELLRLVGFFHPAIEESRWSYLFGIGSMPLWCSHSEAHWNFGKCCMDDKYQHSMSSSQTSCSYGRWPSGQNMGFPSPTRGFGKLPKLQSILKDYVTLGLWL